MILKLNFINLAAFLIMRGYWCIFLRWDKLGTHSAYCFTLTLTCKIMQVCDAGMYPCVPAQLPFDLCPSTHTHTLNNKHDLIISIHVKPVFPIWCCRWTFSTTVVIYLHYWNAEFVLLISLISAGCKGCMRSKCFYHRLYGFYYLNIGNTEKWETSSERATFLYASWEWLIY